MKSKSGLMRFIGLAVAAIGWAVSVYLFFASQMGQFVCPVGDCQTVNSSEYAKIGSVPVSLLGIIFYLFVLCLWVQVPFFSAKVNQLLLGTLLGIGLIFSAYLTYAELFWIHALCFWCIISFSCVVLLNLVYWIKSKKSQ
jgi:uncharacterized membrane protein